MSANPTRLVEALEGIRGQFAGELHLDSLTRQIFATDASVYEEVPAAVAFPRSVSDLQLLIGVAHRCGVGLIPRTAGTSLAGQVVGSGIVLDLSRHFTRILEVNPQQGWVRVEPGVIRNELNQELARSGLMFGPETSTQNRAMIGGMLGNNSCGANSIVYGSTRDQTLEVEGLLSDGTHVVLGPMEPAELESLLKPGGAPPLLQSILQGLVRMLSDKENQREIRDGFPLPAVHRRNTGYALDALLDRKPFADSGAPFSLTPLIAGSEGTLFLATAIKLKCHPLPPPHRVLVCAHFANLEQSLRATPLVMQFPLTACELIDHHVLAGAARNIAQQKNMGFVSGHPAAVLLLEMRGQKPEELMDQAHRMIALLQESGLGYAWPVFRDAEAEPVWDLRKAGQGVVSSMAGDDKPVTVIEDTAVALADFADYSLDVERLLREKYHKSCVFYGHAGAGELHLRPILNLKTAEGLAQFRGIATDVAELVRRYRGSLSGEHGDGRLRGEFLPLMIGPRNYQLLCGIKQLFDPAGVFNPGKITGAPPMDEALRVPRAGESAGRPPIETVFDFSATHGILGAAEMCNGSGDCRKTHRSGGTMCPSYMATHNERDTTRARANRLRQVLAGASDRAALGDGDLKDVMDLCLSCKACKSECPSNVDLAKLKAEFLQGYHDQHGVPLRTRLIAGLDRVHGLGSLAPWLHNFLITSRWTAPWLKRLAGFSPQRALPRLQPVSLRKWDRRRGGSEPAGPQGSVILFCDEFTNHLDTPVGIAAVELLQALGYGVRIVPHRESGRAAISKGLLRKARGIATDNVRMLHPWLGRADWIVGIEPSAILSLVDEYPELVPGDLRSQARELAGRTLLIDDFFSQEILAGKIRSSSFHDTARVVRLHGHCHQKALTSLASTVRMLQVPENYRVRLIPSGCCGMAGSFGYEAEHFEVSMKIGELVLFPAIREEPAENLIAAPGTSCRHQIHDGTGREALHPVQILHAALKQFAGSGQPVKP